MKYYEIPGISINGKELETIDLLESLGIAHDFCLANCLKYLIRFNRKNKSRSEQLKDLQKTQWYLNRLISYYQHSDIIEGE